MTLSFWLEDASISIGEGAERVGGSIGQGQGLFSPRDFWSIIYVIGTCLQKHMRRCKESGNSIGQGHLSPGNYKSMNVIGHACRNIGEAAKEWGSIGQGHIFHQDIRSSMYVISCM